jgi:ribosomal protein L11 methyltransferase
MTLEPCWSLSIEIGRRYLSALVARLRELGFPSIEERPAPLGACVVVYASSQGALEALRDALSSSLPSLGLLPGQLRWRIAEVPPDWALEWTRHLGPVALTSTITLFPHRPEAATRAGELYLEPAFAFGFGEHPSTCLAARWLETSCRAKPGVSVLDVGCGTGVLALVARLAGAGSVLGIDVAEPAILAARANAALNVLDVTFRRSGIAEVAGAFERVVANIEAGVLCELASDIVSRVAPGGELGLAGFIDEQCEGVVRCFASAGLELALRDTLEDWCLLAGTRQA